MKILNLYAGIGGNRKLWPDEHEITAIEHNEEIANIYHDFFPDDEIIITDAHQYLLENYMNYDFIWSSPPCPTHSDARRAAVQGGRYKPLYPDMKLYQEIILLKNFASKKTLWIIENVKPYYEYLISPNIILSRHPFWCNFYIYEKNIIDKRIHSNIKGSDILYGFDLSNYKINNKRQTLRNMVNPELGLYILNQALKKMPDEKTLFD